MPSFGTYRHFNDAAILATILRELPGVVRAASEPIGQIDNLIVLSRPTAPPRSCARPPPT